MTINPYNIDDKRAEMLSLWHAGYILQSAAQPVDMMGLQPKSAHSDCP